MQTTRHPLALLTVAVLASGCQHRAPFSMELTAPTPRIVPIVVTPPAFTLEIPPPEVDVGWLDMDEFLPPGARRIGGPGVRKADLRPTSRTRFPSTDILTAPNGDTVVLCQSIGSGKVAVHFLLWLRLHATGDSTLFRTTKAFDVTWSPDSRHVAVTHLVGENRSEVVVTNPEREVNPAPLELRVALAGHFTEYQLMGPCFVKAYGWTDSSLVVRGVGRTAAPPYSVYGFEVLVDPRRLDDPYAPRFARGFIRDEPEPQVTTAVVP